LEITSHERIGKALSKTGTTLRRARHQQAEFADDDWQVHLNEGTDEYRNPVEFYRRTYITESLIDVERSHPAPLRPGGDPVVQFQTNFGGGKTHSMLALYHLFSGIDPKELAGIDSVMQAALETLIGVGRAG
jgi:predicted AAA+ superfamily ATPase